MSHLHTNVLEQPGDERLRLDLEALAFNETTFAGLVDGLEAVDPSLLDALAQRGWTKKSAANDARRQLSVEN
jgi:hypothetical protein